MIKKLIACIVFIAVLCSFSVMNKPKNSYIIAVDNHYPPFSFLDPNTNAVSGLTVDVARVICEEVGIKCEFVGMEQNDAFAALENNEIDIICVGPGLRIDMGSMFLSSEKYFRSSSLFVGLDDAVKGISKEELAGLKVGVIRGSMQDWYLTAVYKEGIKEKLYAEFNDIMRALLTKDIDLAFVDGMAVYYFLQKDLDMAYDVFGEPVSVGDGAFMLLRKSDSDLLKKLNESILSIHYTSKYEGINAKYFYFFIF
jgi:ABC-type amino acid transport substrate-binding protein